jgi:hypothetical protein
MQLLITVQNLLSLIALCLLCGCAITPVSSREYETQCVVSHDNFRKGTTVTAKKLPFGDWLQNHCRLEASKMDNNPQVLNTISIYTYRASSEGWAFWNQAFDENGTELKKVTYDSEVSSSAGLAEVASFEVPESWLKSACAQRIKLRIDGKRAEQILSFPTNYVQAFVARCSSVFSTPGATTNEALPPHAP